MSKLQSRLESGELDKSMFFDPNIPRSYNTLFNFIVGNRRSGKTYGTLKDCIKRFISKGETFIYLRRYKTEFKKFKSLIQPIIANNEFPDHKLEVKGYIIYVDGVEAGYGIPLSTGKIEKGSNPERVGTIIFDEFLIETGVYHYLRDEVTTFMEFLISVSSYRDVIVFFLANAVSVTNPYFLTFDVKLPTHGNIWRKGEILVQMVNDPNFVDYVKSTRLGSFMVESLPEYADYAIMNEFYLDSENFVEQRHPNSRPLFNMIYKGETFGVWKHEQLMYVSVKYDPQVILTFSMTNEDHTPNRVLFKYNSKGSSIRQFIEAYKLGLVRFDNINIKNICYQIFKSAMI